jgi:RNA polymerase sigma-70 factor, ECF subfamily
MNNSHPGRSERSSDPVDALRDRQEEEAALRRAVIEGNSWAWQTLYDRTFHALYGYVFLRTRRDHHRTDEVVQECWMIAVRRIVSFDPRRGSFQQWLYGIAENVLRNYRRRWQKEAIHQESDRDEVRQEALPSDRLDLAELIGLAYTELPSRYQEVLRARYERQLSPKEIASQWGETHKAIESLLSRARAAFRQAYSRLARD